MKWLRAKVHATRALAAASTLISVAPIGVKFMRFRISEKAARPLTRVSAALVSTLRDPPMRQRIRCHISKEILFVTTHCV